MQEVVAPQKRRQDKAQSPKHHTGVPPARNSQHGLVFLSEDLVILGARRKALGHQPCVPPRGGFGRQLPPMQLQALSVGKAWPSLGVPGFAGGTWRCPAGMFSKGKGLVRSES